MEATGKNNNRRFSFLPLCVAEKKERKKRCTGERLLLPPSLFFCSLPFFSLSLFLLTPRKGAQKGVSLLFCQRASGNKASLLVSLFLSSFRGEGKRDNTIPFLLPHFRSFLQQQQHALQKREICGCVCLANATVQRNKILSSLSFPQLLEKTSLTCALSLSPSSARLLSLRQRRKLSLT